MIPPSPLTAEQMKGEIKVIEYFDSYNSIDEVQAHCMGCGKLTLMDRKVGGQQVIKYTATCDCPTSRP